MRSLLAVIAALFIAGCGGPPGPPGPTPAPMPLFSAGPTIYGTQFHEDHAVDETELSLAHDDGFTMGRQSMQYTFIENKDGTFDWDYYDMLQGAFDKYKIQVLWITSEVAQPVNTATYKAFFVAAVKRYPGHKWEFWNEPNIVTEWCQPGSPANCEPNVTDYLALAIPVVQAMKAADPTCVISTGGTSGVDLAWIQGLINGGAFAPGNFDALGIHPYGQTPDIIQVWYSQVAALLPKGIPIWSTEYGDDPANADDMTAMYEQHVIMGVPVFIQYEFKDEVNNPRGDITLEDIIKNDMWNPTQRINRVPLTPPTPTPTSTP